MGSLEPTSERCGEKYCSGSWCAWCHTQGVSACLLARARNKVQLFYPVYTIFENFRLSYKTRNTEIIYKCENVYLHKTTILT